MKERFPQSEKNSNKEVEQVEKFDDVIEIDPYLKKLRQQEALNEDKKELQHEMTVRRTVPEHIVSEKLLTETKEAIADLMRKDSTIDGVPVVTEKKEEKKEEEKKIMSPFSVFNLLNQGTKKAERMAKRLFKRSRTFGMSLLFGIGGLLAGHKAAAGGEDSLEKKGIPSRSNEQKEISKEALTPQVMQEWNSFLDFVKEEGFEGSPELDKDQTIGKSLLEEYRKLHPYSPLRYEHVSLVQNEMQKLKQSSQDFARRRNDPNADNIMANVSRIDGWFGSKTSQFRFPAMSVVSYHNNAVVSKENLGLVNGNLTPAKIKQIEKQLPRGMTMKNIEKLSDGYYYEDPETGDLKRVQF